MMTTSEPQPHRKAYISEPITRCPPREKGRIKTLIGQIKETLAQEPYLTSVYVPSEVTAPEVRREMLPEHVYLLDRIRVIEADYMLVVADQTSFGIGGEVEMAGSLGKPVIIFSRSEKLSRFLIGTPANACHKSPTDPYFLTYTNWRDLKPQLLPLVEKVIAETDSRQHENLPFWDVGRHLRELRNERKMSVEALAQASDLGSAQIRILEKSIDEIRRELASYQDDAGFDFGSISLTPHQVEQLANIGLPALRRLAMALEVPLIRLLGDAGEEQNKGPSREIKGWTFQLEKQRTESLKARAAQYHISYREFEDLKEQLVDRFLERLPAAETPNQKTIIQEKEFLDALARVRRI